VLFERRGSVWGGKPVKTPPNKSLKLTGPGG